MPFHAPLHIRSRLAPGLLTLLLCTVPLASQARDTLNWLLRDLPPSTVFAGPQQGRGAIDQLMPLLIARMPEFDHVLVRVNRARSTQMLMEHPSSCDPTLLWTAERARTIAFSIPTYVLLSSGLIVRKETLPRFAMFLDDGEVDLRRLLSVSGIKIGAVAQRSYGALIDDILSHSNDDAVNLHYGAEAVGSLLQMERLGRLQALLGYWPEVRYQALLQGMAPEELAFVPVKGNPAYQYAHIGCSDTPQGRQAIQIINREMHTLRESRLMGFYAQWLEPSQRSAYLEAAKAYFDSH